jgi:hypothetical protein
MPYEIVRNGSAVVKALRQQDWEEALVDFSFGLYRFTDTLQSGGHLRLLGLQFA